MAKNIAIARYVILWNIKVQTGFDVFASCSGGKKGFC